MFGFGPRMLHVKQIILFDVDLNAESKMAVHGLANLRYGFHHFPYQFCLITHREYITTDIVKQAIESISEIEMARKTRHISYKDESYSLLMSFYNTHETDIGSINISPPAPEILVDFGWPRNWARNPESKNEYTILDAIKEHRLNTQLFASNPFTTRF